jgi:hypothetical protein
MTTKLVKEIDVLDGAYEIAVYRDGDGYHSEVWDDTRQLICYQSGDVQTKAEAIRMSREHLALVPGANLNREI